jgi:hypothetical protein
MIMCGVEQHHQIVNVQLEALYKALFVSVTTQKDNSYNNLDETSCEAVPNSKPGTLSRTWRRLSLLQLSSSPN